MKGDVHNLHVKLPCLHIYQKFSSLILHGRLRGRPLLYPRLIRTRGLDRASRSISISERNCGKNTFEIRAFHQPINGIMVRHFHVCVTHFVLMVITSYVDFGYSSVQLPGVIRGQWIEEGWSMPGAISDILLPRLLYHFAFNLDEDLGFGLYQLTLIFFLK